MVDADLNIYLSALTTTLIDACGGLIQAALECDISKSALQRAADPNHDYTLKASTIWHLEQACGEPILSRALYEMNQAKPSLGKTCPLFLGIDFADSATDLTVLISGTLKDGHMSVFERRELTARTSQIRTDLTKLVKSFHPTGAELPAFLYQKA